MAKSEVDLPSESKLVPLSGNLARKAMQEAGFSPTDDIPDVGQDGTEDSEQQKSQAIFARSILQNIAKKKAKMPEPRMSYIDTRAHRVYVRDPVRQKPGPELENMQQFMREPETTIPQIIQKNIEGTQQTLSEGVFRRAAALRK